MKELVKSFNNQPIIKRGKKRYLAISITDHFSITKPILIKQAVNAICDSVNWNGKTPINAVVGEEERGGFIAVSVALQRNLPFTLAKQYPVHLPGEIGISFSMDYNAKMNLFLNGLRKGDRAIILDDIIATGGTIIAILRAVKKAGVIVNDVVALAEKVEMGGVERVKRETGYNVKTIIKIDTSGSKSKVIGTIFDPDQ